MQLLERAKNLCDVEEHPCFPPLMSLAEIQTEFVSKDPVEVLPRQILENKVDALLVDKRFDQRDNEVERPAVGPVHSGICRGCGRAYAHSLHKRLLLLKTRGVQIRAFRTATLNLAPVQGIHLEGVSVVLEPEEDRLFVFDVLDPLPGVYSGLGNDFECQQFVFVDDQVDWAKLAVANLNARIFVLELLFSAGYVVVLVRHISRIASSQSCAQRDRLVALLLNDRFSRCVITLLLILDRRQALGLG